MTSAVATSSPLSTAASNTSASRPRRRAGASATSLGFVLFLLVNGVLFIRPTELFQPLEGLPAYEALIIACLLVSSRVVLPQLRLRTLRARPITVAVLGLMAAAVSSHLCHGRSREGVAAGIAFAKLVVYYLLLVGLVTTRGRLKVFLASLAAFIAALTLLSLLQYHHAIDLPALSAYEDHAEEGAVDDVTGKPVMIERLRACGIFNDPNDLALILIFGAATSLYLSGSPGADWRRWGWRAVAALFLYALFMTHSRGGFLALLAAVGGLNFSRFGWRKTAVLSLVLLPPLFVLFGGRQTHISTDAGTAQDRIQNWSDGLQLFKQSPLAGIGMNRYADAVGLVAHNSFLHCFVELGFFGGVCFLGAFAYAAFNLHRMKSAALRPMDSELRRFRPYLFGIVAAYAVGYLSLSRPYVASTHLIFGLGAVYLRIAPRPPRVMPPLTMKLACVGALLGFGFIAAAYGFVVVFARWK